MENKGNMQAEESLAIIREMIGRAKKSFSKISFHFLLWGWLLFFAGIGQYILLRVLEYEHFYIVWPIIGAVGGIAASIYGAKQKKSKKVQAGYMDKVYSYVWGGFIISLILIIMGCLVNSTDPNPMVMLLTALPTFITGGAIKFRPLILGAVVFWVLGSLNFFFLKEYSSLVFSVAILLGYIIPGHLLNNAEQHGKV